MKNQVLNIEVNENRNRNEYELLLGDHQHLLISKMASADGNGDTSDHSTTTTTTTMENIISGVQSIIEYMEDQRKFYLKQLITAAVKNPEQGATRLHYERVRVSEELMIDQGKNNVEKMVIEEFVRGVINRGVRAKDLAVTIKKHKVPTQSTKVTVENLEHESVYGERWVHEYTLYFNIDNT